MADSEEERLFRLYKEQAEGVGPILAKTLQDSLKLRGKSLEKLEAEIKEQLASLKTDEKVLLHVLEKQFGEEGSPSTEPFARRGEGVPEEYFSAATTR